MAKKTQEEFIESLIEETNGNYSKQKMQLEKLLEKLDKAVEDGASNEVLGLISGEISKLEESISKQNEYVSGFYEEMVNLAGGRRDLDSNMLKDVMDFRETYVKMNEKIKDLQESYRNEQQGNNNPAELDRINKEIQAKIDEYEKKYEKLKHLYGVNSYATQAADNFMHDADAQAKVLDNINAKEKGSVVNNQAIGRAIAANNDALKNGSIIWDTIKKTTGEIWSQVKDGGNMWLKFNAQAISDSKRLGFTSKEAARGYTKYLMDSSKELSRNFGMTAEQAMKMQEAFSKATGKASLLSKSQMEDIAASSKLMGDEAVSNAIEMMDNMGSTSQQATELLDKNYARAVNSGLDTVKASDAFVKNMSLANKMSFRNGVDGISKMTIMSQRIKLNLQEVANVAEKFGSIEGDGAAAMRYTEARPSEMTQKFFFDGLKNDTVDFIPNYDETEREPTLLPVKIPNLLISGTEGIAVGMASKMPSHNANEVIDAVIMYMDNPKVTTEELMTVLPGPDFATGGIIANKSDILDIYKTGTGKLRIRGRVEIEEGKNGKTNLVVTEIPYTMIGSISKFMDSVADLIRAKTRLAL